MNVRKVLTRVFVEPGSLDRHIAFYEAVFGVPCRLRFPYPAYRLELAEVGSVLLIAGTEADLQPFVTTRATFMVDSLDEARRVIEAGGATIVEQPVATPTGVKMRARHPDGAVIEYVQHADQFREPDA